MNKKVIKISTISIFILLLFVIITFLVFYKSVFKNKEIKLIDLKLYTGQNVIDEELLSYYNDDVYTFNTPKIVMDPYKRSPLSALIIFKTKNDFSIDLYINGVFVTQMEKSKNHAIPIIGLIEDYENVIKLVCNKEEKIIKINTEKQNIEYKYESSDNNKSAIFFGTSKSLFATTDEGKINWIIKGEYYNFEISKLKNIYYVDEEKRIIESDFLGKIKKIYLLPTTVDYHYLNQLSNNNYLVTTYDNYILEINYETGEIVKKYDIEKILLNIDEKFLLPSELHVNYIDYHETENYMIISLRGLDAIIKYNIKQEEIDWILTDNKLFGKKFNNYKLNLTYGRYPKGQHTPHLIDDKLYVFNNDYKLYEDNDKSESSASIYEITGKNVKEIYEYKNGTYSYAYGSFNILKNNNKLINFGSNLIINAFESKIYEINELDEIAQHYIFAISVYRTFENSFYNQHTSNYNFENTKTIENKNIDLEKYLVNIPRFKLAKAPINGLLVSIDNSNIKININPEEIKTQDEIKFLFISAGKTYCFPYKIKDNNYIYNVNNYLMRLKGLYAIYAIINNEYYDTNIVLNIK